MAKAAVALLALILLDAVSGFAYRTDTHSRVSVLGPRGGTDQRTFVIFPGHVMSGSLVAEAFRPYLKPSDALVAVDYPERGIDVRDLYAAIRRELDALKPSSVVVYGASMGGMVAADFLRRYAADGMPYGKVSFVLDTAPSSADDVRRPEWMFRSSCLYRAGVVSTLVWAAISSLAAQPDPEPGADRGLVSRAHSDGAWVGMPAATSQACFMWDTPRLRVDELDAVTSRATYIHGLPDTEDPLIDTPKAIERWRIGLPHLTVQPLTSRRASWHVPLVERPAETVVAIERALATPT